MKQIRATTACSFIAACAIVILATLCSSARAETHAWKPFSSDAGRFHVLMPGTPAHKTHSCSSPVGDIFGNIYKVENDVFVVVLEYSDLPSVAALFGSRNTIYTKSIEAFLDDVKGRTMSDRKITLDAYIGREITYETASQRGKARFLLIGRRLYVLQIGVDKGSDGAISMDDYLNSFKPIYRENRRG